MTQLAARDAIAASADALVAHAHSMGLQARRVDEPNAALADCPLVVSTTANRRPSGLHTGAELLPRKLASTRRWPLTRSCT